MLGCRSFRNSIDRYFLVDHSLLATSRKRTAARFNADCPSVKAPTSRVRRRISRRIRSRDVRAYPTPVLFWKLVVRQRLLHPPLNQLRRRAEFSTFSVTSPALVSRLRCSPLTSLVVAGLRVAACLGSRIALRVAQPVGFGVKQRVQRLLDRPVHDRSENHRSPMHRLKMCAGSHAVPMPLVQPIFVRMGATQFAPHIS